MAQNTVKSLNLNVDKGKIHLAPGEQCASFQASAEKYDMKLLSLLFY
jgi:hypothetical protein